jgi:lysyl-tRNA synthetase class 2
MMLIPRQNRIQKNLCLRAKMVAAIRRHFKKSGFLEVETPCRIPTPIPEAHIDTEVSEDWFLHPSPELCMKRLLAAGFTRIYQICKCFRKNERGARHLPEMTLLEWYATGIDYVGMMRQCEDLVTAVAGSLGLYQGIDYQERFISLKPPWDRMTVRRAFEIYAPVSLDNSIKKNTFDETMVSFIEPRLGFNKPVFLYDYPSQFGSLAKTKRQDPLTAERFELYIAGIELCNAFTELNDSAEQRKRFEIENEARRTLGKPAYPLPETFLNALDRMPPAAGNALGIDRLVMLFANTACIDDVVAFTPEEL